MLKEDKKSKFKQGFTKSTAKGGTGYFMGTWEAGRRKTDELTPALWFSEEAVGFDDIKKHYERSLATDSKIDGRVETDDSGNWTLVISPTSKVKTKTALVKLVRAFAESYKDDSKLTTIVKKNDFKKITEGSVKVQRKRSLRPVERDEIAPPRPLGELEDEPEDDFSEGSEIIDEGTFEIPENVTLFLPTRSQVEKSKAGKPNSSKDADHSSYVKFLETLDLYHLQYQGGVIPWAYRDDAAEALITLRKAIKDWVEKHTVFKRDRRNELKKIHELIEEHLKTLRNLQIEAAIARGSEAFDDPRTAPQELMILEQSLKDDLEDETTSKEDRLLLEARLEALKRQTARLKLDKVRSKDLGTIKTEGKKELLTETKSQLSLVEDLLTSEGLTRDSGRATKTAVLTVEKLLSDIKGQLYSSELAERDGTDEVVIDDELSWGTHEAVSKDLGVSVGKLLDTMAKAGAKKDAKVILKRFEDLAVELIALELALEAKTDSFPGSVMRQNDMATNMIRVVLERTDNSFVSRAVDLETTLGVVKGLSAEKFAHAMEFLNDGTQPHTSYGYTFSSTHEAEEIKRKTGEAIIAGATKVMDAILVALDNMPAPVKRLAQTSYDEALKRGGEIPAASVASNIVMLRWLNPQITKFLIAARKSGSKLDSALVNQVQNLIQKVANEARPKPLGSIYNAFLTEFQGFYDTYIERLSTVIKINIERYTPPKEDEL